MPKPKSKPSAARPNGPKISGPKINAPKPKASKSDDARSKYTAFRCPEDLLELAKYKASQARRSLSNYLVYLIAQDVEKSDQ